MAESEMELRVAQKLGRAARTRAHRKIHRGDRVLDVPQDEVKLETMAAPPLGINAQINSYLTLCPDLTPQEALWLVCRVVDSNAAIARLGNVLADVIGR